MTKKEMEKFKKLLLKMREELISNVTNITEDTRRSQKDAAGDLSGYSIHMADVASDNYDREFLLNLATGERKTLLDIDEALRRIEENTYGKCLSCDRKITKKRLNAVPQAKLCLECKEHEEKK